MCIFFLAPDCPFLPTTDKGRKLSLCLSRSIVKDQSWIPSPSSSRSPSESSPSEQSFLESLSSKTSQDALCESELPINPCHPNTPPKRRLREYLLTNDDKILQIGRCVDPTSANPRMCQKFQARHLPGPSNFAGFFEKCNDCTKAGSETLKELKGTFADQQKNPIENGIFHETCEMCGTVQMGVQYINQASFEFCGTKECETCKAEGLMSSDDEK